MAYKDKQQMYDYNNAYSKEKYDVLRLVASKDDGQRIREAAAWAGQSVSAYIMQAVRERMGKEKAGEG